MPPSNRADANIKSVWHWVSLERARAERAAAVARRHEEAQARIGEAGNGHHARLAELYRRIEERHVAASRMHTLHALRLQRWAALDDGLQPVFMAAVATMMGVDSAAVMLSGQSRSVALMASSDDTARAAQDLEFVLGEGPATDVAARSWPIVAVGSQLWDRWPQFGPAVAELGVRTVIATPLSVPSANLGVLCGFDRRGDLDTGTADTVDRTAAALTHTMLLTAGDGQDVDGLPVIPLFETADFHAVVHQASGVVSVRAECTVDDALAMLRARAFTDGVPLDVLAQQVLDKIVDLP